MSDSEDVVARARHRRTDRDEVPAQDGRDLEVEPGVGVLAAVEVVRVIAGPAAMSTSTLHRVEHGQRELTLSEIVALARALETTSSTLIRLPILAPANGPTDAATRAAQARTPVNPAFEVSPDDPQEVAEAIARAVADIVPATVQPARALRDPRHIQISQMMAERFGPPTLADYRRAYDSSGTPWPGDDYIRRNHPVADAS